MSASTLFEHLSVIRDPRQAWKVNHSLYDILLLTICAVIGGADGWEEIELWGTVRLEWLKKFGDFEHGIPAHDTIARVVSRISPGQLQKCFVAWMQSCHDLSEGSVIAIDGKTVRRSFRNGDRNSAIHMVSAFSAENNVVLGQIKTDEKSNEITAIPALLNLLAIQGCLITVDAMGCQREIAKKVVEKGGDFLLSVKGNQGNLEAAFDNHFPMSVVSQYQGDSYATEEQSRNRREQRFHIVSEIPDGSEFVDQLLDWPEVKTLGVVVSARSMNEEVPEISVRYYISSADLSARKLADAVRSHWDVENRLHYKLDVGFREDDCRIRRGDAAENFVKVRHVALNLLNAETTFKGGVKKRRMHAGLSTDYMEKVLEAVAWRGVS